MSEPGHNRRECILTRNSPLNNHESVLIVFRLSWEAVRRRGVSLPHQANDEGRSDRRQLLMAPGLWVSRTLWYGLIRVGGSVVPHQTEDEGRSDRRQLLMAPGLWVSRTLWYGLWCGYW